MKNHNDTGSVIFKFVIFLAIFLFIISCKNNEKNENKLIKQDYQLGDTWIEETIDAKGNIYTRTTTITSLSYLFDGQETIVAEWQADMDKYIQESGEIIKNVKSSGEEYISKINGESIFSELRFKSRMLDIFSDNWSNAESITTITREITGDIPLEPLIGETWIFDVKEIVENKLIIDGSEIQQGGTMETKSRTVNVELLGKKSVSVKAGTFDCFEIKRDMIEEGIYFLGYYAPEVRTLVKFVQYENSMVTSSTELISYDIK